MVGSSSNPRFGQYFTSNERGTKGKENICLNYEIQNGFTCFLNSFSERRLGAVGSSPSSRLGQWFMSKGLCMHNQSFKSLS